MDFRPGSSHIRLGSVKPQWKSSIPSGEPWANPHSSTLLKVQPVDPVIFYRCIWPPTKYHISIGFRWRDGDGCSLSGRIDMQTAIFELWLRWKPMRLPVLLCVSYFLTSVTKLWDMIICLCMCNGPSNHVNDLESKLHCKTAETFSSLLHLTVTQQSKSNISYKICKQNLSEWCHMCHRKSSQCAWRIDLNKNRHAEFNHLSNCITCHRDLVHMVAIFEIACCTLWKLRRRSWIRNGEEVELYLLKTGEMIYMPSIAGRKRESLIYQQNVSMSLGASGSVWQLSDQNHRVAKSRSLLDRRSALRCTWEHLGAPVTRLGAPRTNLGAPAKSLAVPATSLGTPRITVEQSGRNNIFFGNPASAPGNHIYYLSFSDL